MAEVVFLQAFYDRTQEDVCPECGHKSGDRDEGWRPWLCVRRQDNLLKLRLLDGFSPSREHAEAGLWATVFPISRDDGLTMTMPEDK